MSVWILTKQIEEQALVDLIEKLVTALDSGNKAMSFFFRFDQRIWFSK